MTSAVPRCRAVTSLRACLPAVAFPAPPRKLTAAPTPGTAAEQMESFLHFLKRFASLRF